jgi:hypothetical protein
VQPLAKLETLYLEHCPLYKVGLYHIPQRRMQYAAIQAYVTVDYHTTT